MGLIIINTDYPEFLRWLYTQHPGLEKQSYEEQMQVRMDSLFGMADFYPSNLRKLGHEVGTFMLTMNLCKEHGVQVEEAAPMPKGWREAFQRARYRLPRRGADLSASGRWKLYPYLFTRS